MYRRVTQIKHFFHTTPLIMKHIAALLSLLFTLLSGAIADDYAPVFVLRPGTQSYTKLLLFVPGGKVPPEDYYETVRSALMKTKGNAAGVIVRCGKLNLCDPLGQLPGLMDKAITQAEQTLNSTFLSNDIFVIGHSLGGVGARHYVDTKYAAKGPSAFAGLALLGTQYNGDHEDFKGTLGYPMSLDNFSAPLLALLGEIDMVPTSHAALLFSQWDTLPNAETKAQKSIVIVPGMDHSQFCSPFNVSGDIQPEITNEQALHVIGTVLASWIDAVLFPSSATDAIATLHAYTENSTRPITGAFLAARAMEKEQVCQQAQDIILRDLPNASTLVSKIDMTVVVPNGSANLEHTHTNFSRVGDRLQLKIGSYPYYPSVSSWNPIAVLAPNYSGASDISCKLVSADRVAQQFKIVGYFPQKEPSATCIAINQWSIDTAISMLSEHWPAAIKRWQRRGRNITIEEDSKTIAGPQWVFASSLKFDEEKAPKPARIQSPELYSSISSLIFPGNYYCKVVSPAKVVEWLQTRSIDGRY